MAKQHEDNDETQITQDESTQKPSTSTFNPHDNDETQITQDAAKSNTSDEEDDTTQIPEESNDEIGDSPNKKQKINETESVSKPSKETQKTPKRKYIRKTPVVEETPTRVLRTRKRVPQSEPKKKSKANESDSSDDDNEEDDYQPRTPRVANTKQRKANSTPRRKRVSKDDDEEEEPKVARSKSSFFKANEDWLHKQQEFYNSFKKEIKKVDKVELEVDGVVAPSFYPFQ